MKDMITALHVIHAGQKCVIFFLSSFKTFQTLLLLLHGFMQTFFNAFLVKNLLYHSIRTVSKRKLFHIF